MAEGHAAHQAIEDLALVLGVGVEALVQRRGVVVALVDADVLVDLGRVLAEVGSVAKEACAIPGAIRRVRASAE